MKNIVFDLGGVLFARDKTKCSQEFIDFFEFLRDHKMPEFWEEYDRGALTFDQTKDILCQEKGCSRETCDRILDRAIALQEPIRSTEQLVCDLKQAGYKLYVLSNMSAEFIAFLRRFPVYSCFDGEVVSCEERTIKPEPRIYEILMERYSLDPMDTLFIDDRPANLDAAACFGINTFLFKYREPVASCEELRGRLLQGC